MLPTKGMQYERNPVLSSLYSKLSIRRESRVQFLEAVSAEPVVLDFPSFNPSYRDGNGKARKNRNNSTHIACCTFPYFYNLSKTSVQLLE